MKIIYKFSKTKWKTADFVTREKEKERKRERKEGKRKKLLSLSPCSFPSLDALGGGTKNSAILSYSASSLHTPQKK